MSPHPPVRPPLRSVKRRFPRTPAPVCRRRADSRRRGRARSTQARCNDACRTCDPRGLAESNPDCASQQSAARSFAFASRQRCQRRAASRAEYPLRIRASIVARCCSSLTHGSAGSATSRRDARATIGRVAAAGAAARVLGAAPAVARGRSRRQACALAPQGRSLNTGVAASRHAYTSLVRRPEGRASTRSITGAPPASAGCDVSCEATASAGARGRVRLRNRWLVSGGVVVAGCGSCTGQPQRHEHDELRENGGGTPLHDRPSVASAGHAATKRAATRRELLADQVRFAWPTMRRGIRRGRRWNRSASESTGFPRCTGRSAGAARRGARRRC